MPSEKVIFGGNAGAYPYDRTCNNISNVSGVMWYTVAVSRGETVSLTTSYPYTNFPTTISVYEGACDDLQCVTASNNGHLSLSPDNSTLFYVAISGQDNASGAFAFTASKSNLQQSSSCDDAVAVYVGKEFPVVIVDNFPAQTSNLSTTCESDTRNPTNVQWFRVTPPFPGSIYAGGSDNRDTKYYTGTCDDLVQVCNYNEMIYSGPMYVAAAYNGDSGSRWDEFSIHISADPVNQTSCASSGRQMILDENSPPNPFSFSTVGQSTFMNDTCQVQESSVYWFNVTRNTLYEYTENTLELNTCSNATTFDTLLTVYNIPCDTLTCVSSTNTPCPNGERGSMLSVKTSEEQLLVVVGAADGKSAGVVEMTMSLH